MINVIRIIHNKRNRHFKALKLLHHFFRIKFINIDKPENKNAASDGFGPEIVLGEKGTRWGDFRALTVHNFVTEQTPPAFLWKTSADLPTFSTKYAQACKEHGVECELHIFSDRNRCAAMEFDRGLAWQYREGIAENTKLWGELAVNWLHYIYEI